MNKYIVMSKNFESILERVSVQSGMNIIDSQTPDIILVEAEDFIAKKFGMDNPDVIVEEG